MRAGNLSPLGILISLLLHSLVHACVEHLVSIFCLTGLIRTQRALSCEVLPTVFQKHAFDECRSEVFWTSDLGCNFFPYLHLKFLKLWSFKLIVHVMDEKWSTVSWLSSSLKQQQAFNSPELCMSQELWKRLSGSGSLSPDVSLGGRQLNHWPGPEDLLEAVGTLQSIVPDLSQREGSPGEQREATQSSGTWLRSQAVVSAIFHCV